MLSSHYPSLQLFISNKHLLPNPTPAGSRRFNRLITMAAATGQDYDRLQEVKNFDESKVGVKGLVDSGINSIPRFFHHPPESLPKPKPATPTLTVPVIDLSGRLSTVVEQIHQSASALGFFQIINHGVPQTLIDSIISAIKSFNEESTEYKMRYYHREMGRGASYSTNFDLYQSKAASWRDTLQVRLAPGPPNWDAVPEMCRPAIEDWDREVLRLGEMVMGFLCEGLGVEKGRLKDLGCLDARIMVGHYYPYCPQPELTVGLTSHTDPGAVTLLVQNEVGGLQVKYGEDDWADVEYIPGAIVINIGDIFQIMSNDKYKSVEHRVLANPIQGARVSVVVFFNPSNREALFGPFPELISAEKPAVYKQFTFADFMRRFFTKELDGKTLTNYYRVHDMQV